MVPLYIHIAHCVPLAVTENDYHGSPAVFSAPDGVMLLHEHIH